MAENQPSGNTPAAPTGETPKPGEQTPSQPGTPADTVTLPKDQHDELQKKAAQAATAQSEADTLKTKLQRYERPGRKVPTPEPLEAAAIVNIKNKITSSLLENPKYTELVQKNPTLRKVLAKNPLDLLDGDTFIDEDDAINQVLDFLDTQITVPNVAPTPVISSAPAPQATNPDDTVTPTVDTPLTAAQKEVAERNAKLPPIKRITNTIAGRLKINEPS